MILPSLLFILIFGPVPEELGWRGYALDGLQSRWNNLSASVILGIVWALWHLPLFFIGGTYQQAEVGFGTLRFWSFMSGMLISSVLFTWIYNNTSRSILSAILFHFSINFSGEIFLLSEREYCYQPLLVTVAALLVVAVWGYKKMTLPTTHQREGLSQVQNNYSNQANQCNKTPVERSTFR
jgi:membrane protease YdiL (CAAX protease family)